MIRLRLLLPCSYCALMKSRLMSFWVILLLMIVGGSSGVKAAGPTIGTTYKITGITLTSYGPYVALPAHAFNSNAKSIKLSVTGSALLKTAIMKGGVHDYSGDMETSYGDGNVSGVCLNLSGDYVTAAKNGKLLVGAGNGTGTYTVYVTNYNTEDGALNDANVGVTAEADNVIDANNPGSSGGGSSEESSSGNSGSGEGEGSGNNSDNNPTNTGLTDLGVGSFYGYGEYTYSYKGTSTNMIVGTKITYTTTTGNVDTYLQAKGVGDKWKTKTSFTLTEEDVAALEASNYTFWIASWGASITNVTITLPDGTDANEGDNTGDSGSGEGGETNDNIPSTSSFDFQDATGKSFQVPASAFDKNATSIKITFTKSATSGDMWGFYGFNGSEWNAKNFSGTTESSATVIVSDAVDIAAAATNGMAFQIQSNSTIGDLTVKIRNIVEGGDDSDDDSDDDSGNSSSILEQKIAAKAQLTDVPTIYLTVPDAEGKAINDVLDIKKEYHTATIQLVDDSGELTEFTDQVQIKVRGNSTAKENKKPYRLKFAKEIKDENGTVIAKCQKHDMLGRGPGHEKRNWTLLANFIDPAMIRNALTYHIGEAFNMPFKPGYKFADVVINGEYRGTYQISDHVEVGSDRIEVDEDTGWYLEASRGDMIEAPSYDIFSIKNPEPANEEEETALKAKIDMWFGLLKPMFGFNNGPFDLEKFSDPLTGWRKYFNEESLVDLYTAINLTGDYDGFMTVKMYRNTNERMKFGPLWDKDLAFGNWSNTEGKLVEEMQSGNYFNEYINKIIIDPVFIKKVHDRLHAVLDAGYVANMQAKISELKSLVQQTSDLNHTKWSTSYQSWNLTFTSFDDAVSQLNTYVADRASWFATKIDGMYQDLGGSNIVDKTIGIDYNAETGPTLETEYTVPNMDFVNNQYKDYPIPASAFNNKATSALITVTGPSTIIFKKRTNQYGATATLKTVNSQNSEIITATYLVEGDELEYALNGYLLINCKGNNSITVKVTNYGVSTPDTPTERAQLTNLPTIYLDATEVDGTWRGVALEVFDSENKLGQGATWTKTTADVSVQYQGSGNKSKDSYRLKFESKIKLIGASKYKQWVLLANDDDPTMIHNALAKELGDAIGMPWTPGYQFVDLYLNNAYMGTYQVTDRVKAEDGRSLVTGGNKDADWQLRFNDAAELTEDGTLDYITTTNDVNVIYKNPDPKDMTEEQVPALRKDVKEYFDDFFTKTNDTYPYLADNVDKEQLINWYICQEILGVYKGFSSIEAYRSITPTAADNLLHFGPLWDSEKGFGNHGEADAIDMSDKEISASYLGLITNYAAYGEMKNIFNYLWTQSWFGSGVRDKWNALQTAGLLATLKSKADAISATLSESQPKNAEKWTGSIGGAESYAATITSLKSYLDTRFAYLDTKFNARAAGLCEHEYKSYVDNGDGTHSQKCSKCNTVNTVKTTHNYIAKDGHPYCAICNATESASIEGTDITDNTKVYRIHESEDAANIKYVSAESSLNPNSNKIYICNEEITGETNLKNVAWPRSADEEYNADEIVFTDGDYIYDKKSIHAKTVSYTRNMTSTWGTLCLPFKIASCDDYTLYEISNTRLNSDGTGTLVFNEIESAGGLKPVVFRKNTSATSVTFHGVAQTKEGADKGLVTVKKSKELGHTDALLTTDVGSSGTWKLYGNAKVSNNTAMISSDYTKVYYIASNKFWKGTADVTVAPFRAVFVLTPTPGSETAAKSFTISAGSTSTEIKENSMDKNLAVFVGKGTVILDSNYDTSIAIYKVGGTLVRKAFVKKGVQKHVVLPSGMYLVNGTKVVVK